MSQFSKPQAIPGSDGSGVVLQAGANTAFAPGDRVVTFLCPEKFQDESLPDVDDTTLPKMAHISSGLGQGVNGTMTTIGVFPQSCLAKIGDGISFEEAATLSCSGITAWNALMGMRGREIKGGDWLLVQGTGGVSVAAMQVSSSTAPSSIFCESKLKEWGTDAPSLPWPPGPRSSPPRVARPRPASSAPSVRTTSSTTSTLPTGAAQRGT